MRTPPRPRLLLPVAAVLLLALVGCGQPRIGAARVDGPRLTFRERAYDFGRVSASRPTEYRFAFTNTGNRPLEITDVQPEPASPGG